MAATGIFATALFLALAAAPLVFAEVPLYLGILESFSAEDPPVKRLNPAGVRVVFQHAAGHWQAFPHKAENGEAFARLLQQFPKQISWTAAFEGKAIGAFGTVRPETLKNYSEIGLHTLLPVARTPQLKQDARSFGTWLGEPPFRPLVVVSQPNYADPDHWKAIRPASGLAKQAYPAFRSAVKLLRNCDGVPTGNYPDEYIKFLTKAYQSSRGDLLLGLCADPARNQCWLNYEEWDSVWFFVRGKEIALIGMGLNLD